MGKARIRYRSGESLRKLCTIALLILAGLTIWEFVDLLVHYLQPGSAYRYLKPSFQFKIFFFTPSFFHFGIVTLLASLFALVTCMWWIYRGVNNLQAMGIQTHSSASWALTPILIPPLFLVVPMIMLRDLINKNDQVYRFLRKGVAFPKTEPYSNRFLQRLITTSWLSFLACRLIIFIGFSDSLDEGYQGSIPGEDLFFFVTFYIILYLGPLVLFIYVLWQVGKLENAVGEIYYLGKIEQYRKLQISGGRLVVKQGEAPEWFQNPGEQDEEEESVFVDQ